MDMIGEIGELIYRKRINLGMARNELGSLINASIQTISKWEKGEMLPKMQNMVKLAEVLGIDKEEYLPIYKIEVEEREIRKESYVTQKFTFDEYAAFTEQASYMRDLEKTIDDLREQYKELKREYEKEKKKNLWLKKKVERLQGG